MGATWLARTPEPWTVEGHIAYDVTHTVFHLTDWGENPDGLPPDIADYLATWLPAWIDDWLDLERWDLLGELLVIDACLPRPTLDERAWQAFAAAQQPDGAMPAIRTMPEGTPDEVLVGGDVPGGDLPRSWPRPGLCPDWHTRHDDPPAAPVARRTRTARRRGPDPEPGRPARRSPPPDDRVLADTVTASDAPDVVFALSRNGHRTVLSGGTAPPPPLPREELRYEIGSANKTFTGLLLTRLIHAGALSGGEPATALLDGGRPVGATPVTLAHLITHTSGLPALPAGFFLRGLPAWHTNPYARFPGRRRLPEPPATAAPRHPLALLQLRRRRPRTRTGPRDRHTGGGPRHRPGAAPAGPRRHDPARDDSGLDAVGHGRDGETPVPPFDAGGFQAAGAVRATPYDLLAFLKAHLYPGDAPPDLAPALRAVRRPVLRRGLTHRHVHTVAWFRHATDGGPLYFHGGATLGQQAFLGVRPDTGTALAAVCTRRLRAHDPFVATAYAVLAEEWPGRPGADGTCRSGAGQP